MSAQHQPMPWHEYPRAWNEPPTVTLTIRVHDYIDATGHGMGGRLEAVMDESGNVMQLVGLDPGSVVRCDSCDRLVYVPDAQAATDADCPFTGCAGTVSKRIQFGSRRVEDVPMTHIGGTCSEHPDNACLPQPSPERLRAAFSGPPAAPAPEPDGDA